MISGVACRRRWKTLTVERMEKRFYGCCEFYDAEVSASAKVKPKLGGELLRVSEERDRVCSVFGFGFLILALREECGLKWEFKWIILWNPLLRMGPF